MVLAGEDLKTWSQFTATRSPELREQLVLQSVPLVHYILNRLGLNRECGDDYADLTNQGLLGLIDAVDRFDLSFETRFSTYASLRIRGKILDYLRSSDWLTRSDRRRVREIRRIVNDFWKDQQREPSDDEIAQLLNLDMDSVRRGLDDSRRIFISIDAFFEQADERENDGYEEIADETQPDPEEVAAENALHSQLADVISHLPERQQQVLALYYIEEFTYKEIGVALGVSESRVCQIHSKAIMNIKALMKDE